MRGGYRRGRYKGTRYSRPPSGPVEYDEPSEDKQDFDGGYNPKYHPNSRYPTPPKKTHPFQKQLSQKDPFQQTSSHTHNNKHQNEPQSQEEGIQHYHHHNHYYHHPDGVSPFPTQTATGANNDIMMTDFSAIQVLEERFSKLGGEVVNFLQAMASQSPQTKQFVESFVDYLKQSNPDSELSKVLGGNPSQQNGPQVPVILPAAPFAVLPTAPAKAPVGPKAGPNSIPFNSTPAVRQRTPGSSVDSNDGRNMTPILKNRTRFMGS